MSRCSEPGSGSLGELDQLLSDSDVVTVHLRLSDESRQLLDRRRIGLLRPQTILINTARAALLDEAALLARLRDGSLCGYGADVFLVEPPPAGENPYAELENVVMTPHLADETVETNARLRTLIVSNLLAFHAGRPVNLVS